MYRPFSRQFLFFDKVMNEEVYQFPRIFPTPETEAENRVIVVSGIGSSKPFSVFMTNAIPRLDLLEKTQCFPLYVYAEVAGEGMFPDAAIPPNSDVQSQGAPPAGEGLQSAANEGYIVRLVKQVIHVSLETLRLVEAIPSL